MTSSTLPPSRALSRSRCHAACRSAALLARMLHAEGYDDHLAGHITYRQPDDTFLVNPLGLSWDELCAGDIARMDAEGNHLEGPWIISPAVQLHLVLHQHRHNQGVVLHNHPRGTIWADSHRIPPIYDQTGAMYGGTIAIDSAYQGGVNQRANALEVVEALGDADVALMVNHGVLIIGSDVREAYLRAAVLEWRCRQAWHVSTRLRCADGERDGKRIRRPDQRVRGEREFRQLVPRAPCDSSRYRRLD